MKPAAVLICVFVKNSNYNSAAEVLEAVTRGYSLKKLNRDEGEDPCLGVSFTEQASIVFLCFFVSFILLSSLTGKKLNFQMEKQQKILTPLGYAIRAKVIPTSQDSLKPLSTPTQKDLKENSDSNKVTNDPKERPSSSFKFKRGFLVKRRNSKSSLGSRDSSSHKADSSLVSVLDFNAPAQKVMEGNVSVVYKLLNSDGDAAAIFKPYDPVNDIPQDDDVKLSSKDQCLNEVVAYKFDLMSDPPSRAGVPETRHVELPTGIFDNGAVQNNSSIKGSLQKYVAGAESCDDYGPSLFKTDDVHRIGLLDLRILNCDRHSGNIMFNRDTKTLIPIDHALSFPLIDLSSSTDDELSATFDVNSADVSLKNINFDWLYFPQAKEAFSEEIVQSISKIDMDSQISLMKKARMSLNQMMAVYASTTLLKIGAVQFNKTLYELGSMIQRSGSRTKPSTFEILVRKTFETLKVDQERLNTADHALFDAFCAEFEVVAENYFKL